MRKKIVMMFAAISLLSVQSLFAENKNEKFEVKGNCSMCEKRIEKIALAVKGVSKADWNKETKILEVVFDDSKTSVDKIEIEVAKVGHDTPHHKTSTEVYNKLPDCCKYERKEDVKPEKKHYLINCVNGKYRGLQPPVFFCLILNFTQ